MEDIRKKTQLFSDKTSFLCIKNVSGDFISSESLLPMKFPQKIAYLTFILPLKNTDTDGQILHIFLSQMAITCSKLTIKH